MGIPIEPPGTATEAAHANPARTQGWAFIEFSGPDTRALAELFTKLAFTRVADHRHHDVSLWRQGGIDFLLNGDARTHGGRFAQAHGPCVSAIAFRVADAPAAFARATALGARAYNDDHSKTVSALALEGIGGSLLYLIDGQTETATQLNELRPLPSALAPVNAKLVAIDHLTHNVRAGQLEEWADFYRRIFNFREVFYLDARAAATGFRTRAMKSPCNQICIPVNEPTDPKSQIQEFIDLFAGEGVQHVALASSNLYESVEMLAPRGIPFMQIPRSYYEAVDARLPGHAEDTPRLQRNGILLDGEIRTTGGSWDLLLQIFSKNLLGPTFFEFIQRKGHGGFGEGNAKALFEAIERDQIERGVVKI